MTNASFARTTIHLTEAQRALRALRPSFTSTRLPVRFVAAPIHGHGQEQVATFADLFKERVPHAVPVFVRAARRMQH